MSATMDPIYKIRLENEYKNARQLNQAAKGLIDVKPFPGTSEPYTKYLVTFNFPTLVKVGTSIRHQSSTKVEITLRGQGSPLIAYIPAGDPVPYHPNWWPSGMICNGLEGRDELLKLIDYIEFVFGVLQFQPRRINAGSPANPEATQYWLQNKSNRSLFPTDSHPFPTIGAEQPKKCTIKSIKVTR